MKNRNKTIKQHHRPKFNDLSRYLKHKTVGEVTILSGREFHVLIIRFATWPCLA